MRKAARRHDAPFGDVKKPNPLDPETTDVHRLQRSAGNHAVDRLLADSPGRPLDDATRSYIEPRFGSDFSDVRIHADARAAEAAAAIAARAFTVDRNIVFGSGQYAPQTESRRRLLSHELSHVLQQRSATRSDNGLSQPGDAGEREADNVAHAVESGGSASMLLAASRSSSFAPHRIQRQLDGPPIPKIAEPLPTADELTSRIANCVGIWETNRGKNAPAPKESGLQTVAGVHASMATIEQATMTYTITALKKYKSLRESASPPLTMAELNQADTRCKAVVTLLALVATASAEATTADDFIKAHANEISSTGLSDDDVKTMFSVATLKVGLDIAHAMVTAAKGAKTKTAKMKEVIAAIPESDRLGLGESSLRSYINKPKNWGENRAAWQRKAVGAMAGNVGTRIEQVAISDGGTAMAIPVIRTRVDQQLAKDPKPSLKEIVMTVGQANNPNESAYGSNVWRTYQRLYLK